MIAEFPELDIITKYPKVRLSALKHFSILYKVLESEIIVVAFWDNRQDPKLLLELTK